MANIQLNFLSITPLTFEYEVFRKLKTEEDEKEDDIYVYDLPVEAHGKERNAFLVIFEPQVGFEKFTVSSNETIGLTKRYITRKLVDALAKAQSPFSFQHNKTFTDERVEFIIGTETKGNKIIYLSPYYFEEQTRFGFLIDYEFSLAEGQKFDREVQRLSLSLDRNYKSNRNYYSEKYHLLQGFLSKIYQFVEHIPTGLFQLQLANKLTEVQVSQLNTKEYIFKNNYTSK